MDGGIALPLAEVRGCNTWLMWTAGNRAFWDYLAGQSFGTFDPLKTIDSRERPHRFALFGLMNEPGFVPATAPDQYGLWIDRPTSADAPYGKGFAKADFLRVYGRAIGIVGLRLVRIGPIRQDTPINLLANTDLELSARNAPRLVKLALALKAALRDVKVRGLGGATARLEGLVLLAVSKCPDFAADRGHLFGARLTDDDKHALIAFLQRL
jgi:hypothetical protein